MSCFAAGRASASFIALSLLSGCFGRTPPESLVCPGGEPLAGGRCLGGGDGGVIALDAGPDTGGFDFGPRDLGLLDLGPADFGTLDGGVMDAGPADSTVFDAGGPDFGDVAIPLLIDPERLDFGNVRLSGTQVVEFRLVNPEPRARQVSLSSGDPRVVLDRTSFELPAAGLTVVRAAFLAQNPSPLDSVIEVRACGGRCPVEIGLRGTVVIPGITCTPVDAGTIPAGSCVDTTSQCTSIVDQQGVFEPGSVFGPVAGQVRTDRFAVGERDRFEVRVEVCAPEVGQFSGRFEARVTFPVNAVENLSVPIVVEGQREVPPSCSISAPMNRDFGITPVGQPVDRSITLQNIGPGPCRIDPPRFTGAQAAEYAAASMSPGILAPGATSDIIVRFTPVAAGTRTARLLVGTNDPGRPTVEVELSGQGQAGPMPTGFTVTTRTINNLGPNRGRALAFNNNDDGFVAEQIPFAFEFLGRSVTQVFISTNGFIGFTQNGIGSLRNRAIPSPNTPNELIAWFWDDLNLDLPTSRVTIALDGLSPNRRLVIAYTDVRRFGGGGVNNADTRLEAQISLIEGTNVIEVAYGQARSTVPSMFDASLGWENDNGSAGGSSSACSPNCGLSDWPTNRAITYTPRP